MIRLLLQLIPPCLFRQATGLYCPGCGGTRALLALSQGQFGRSFYYHPLVLYVAGCLLWGLLRYIREAFGQGHKKQFRPLINRLLGGAVIIITVNCLLRNLLYLVWGIPL